MKNIQTAFLGVLSLLVVLILAAGCYRPAAPDVTPTSAGGPEAGTEEGPDLEATAIANSTEAARTLEAATPEGEEPTESPTAPPPTATPEPMTETPAPITPEPTTPAPTTAPTATTGPTGQTTYVVQRGDNLFRIALRFNTTVEAIAQANGIADPRSLPVGTELVIPGAQAQPPQSPLPGTTYVVKPGDNLFRIGLRYNVGWQHLAQYNGITNPSNIYVGQVLVIPPR